MAGRMKNPSISDEEDGYISILVDDTYPANKKAVIMKGKKGLEEKYFMKVGEYDELKGYLYFTVYEAGVLDTDNEFMKSEDLDFMHLDLMKNMKSTKLADINHDQNRLDNVWLMEIYKEYDEDGKTKALKGAYYIKENDYLMQKAKAKAINGVSIMGRVEDIIEEPLSKSEDSMIVKMLFDLKNLLLGKGNIMGKEEIEIKEENDMTKEEIMALSREELQEYGLQKIPKVKNRITGEEVFLDTFTQSEEGILALKDLGYIPTNDGNTDDGNSGSTDDGNTTTDDGSTVPETVEKSVYDEVLVELETIKAELDAVKKEKDIIEKARNTKPDNDAEVNKEKVMSKEQWDDLDAFDKHNFKIENPEIAMKYENKI